MESLLVVVFPPWLMSKSKGSESAVTLNVPPYFGWFSLAGDGAVLGPAQAAATMATSRNKDSRSIGGTSTGICAILARRTCPLLWRMDGPGVSRKDSLDYRR